MKKSKLLLISLLYLITNTLYAQEVIRNFGFEQIDSKGNMIGWELWNPNKQYAMHLDTTIAHSGKCSFVLETPSNTPNRGSAAATMHLIVPNIKSKNMVKVKAYIKANNLQDGFVAIGIQLHGKNGVVTEQNSTLQSSLGTTDWTEHKLEVLSNKDVESIKIALNMSGSGKAWFDDFEIRLDDVPMDSRMILP